QTDLGEFFENPMDGRDVGEESACLLDGHVEDVGNGTVPITHLQGGAVEPPSLAGGARHGQVRQKMEGHAPASLAATFLAAALSTLTRSSRWTRSDWADRHAPTRLPIPESSTRFARSSPRPEWP